MLGQIPKPCKAMQTEPVLELLQSLFPSLYAARNEVPASTYQLIEAPAGATVFDVGGACENYILLTAGLVSVRMLARNGRSVLLYRVEPGQSCVITTSCLLGNESYPSYGEADTPIRALSISRSRFNRALNESETFRRFVFDGLGQRLADLMARLEHLNFSSIDSRLAAALLDNSRGRNRVEITHEKLADEVGTAREVVSRHLKQMETAGLIQLERGAISLANPAGLEKLRH